MATYTVTTGNDVTQYTVSTGARGPAGSAASVTASNILAASGLVTNPTASVIVDPSGTDTDRGNALVAAYAAAKLLTPNGSALSATNRASVVIPPGNYKLTTTLVLDEDFVDMLALVPQMGGRRVDTDEDNVLTVVPASNYRPPVTVIYADDISVTTMRQTARDIRMVGFAVCQLYAGEVDNSEPYTQDKTWRAFHIDGQDANANDRSQYEMMYFFNRCVTNNASSTVQNIARQPVGATSNLKGIWRNCIANGYAWRLSTTGTVFAAAMYDCEFGSNSILGDIQGCSIDGAYMERCKSIGIDQDNPTSSGAQSWGSCTNFGNPITSGTFIDCIGGDKCFALSRQCNGTYIRCRAGKKSFGYVDPAQVAGTWFGGYAEDCVAGSGSFGASSSLNRGGMRGTLIRCTVSDDESDITWRYMTGCTLRSCRFGTIRSNTNLFTLLDSNSKIYDCDLLVAQGGTGVAVFASSARSVAIAHCRMNNASNDADGLHSNVTNLIATPNNVVSDSVT